jgi:hypothetical protein
MRGWRSKANHYHRLSQRALRMAHAAQSSAGDYVRLALAFDRLGLDHNLLEMAGVEPDPAAMPKARSSPVMIPLQSECG